MALRGGAAYSGLESRSRDATASLATVGPFAYGRRMAELHTIEPEPLGDAVVPLLERLLEMAHAGQVSSLGVAMVLRDGSVQSEWTKATPVAALIGAISRLSHRLNLAVDEVA